MVRHLDCFAPGKSFCEQAIYLEAIEWKHDTLTMSWNPSSMHSTKWVWARHEFHTWKPWLMTKGCDDLQLQQGLEQDTTLVLNYLFGFKPWEPDAFREPEMESKGRMWKLPKRRATRGRWVKEENVFGLWKNLWGFPSAFVSLVNWSLIFQGSDIAVTLQCACRRGDERVEALEAILALPVPGLGRIDC